MCGICGVVGDVRDRDAVIRRMSDLIRHRGPDDEGFYYDPDVILGLRRLSIIDLKGGHQPIHNEEGTVWITFNGEIYNFQELREGLLTRGHAFYTKTDTEVMIHLYEEEGIDFVKRLDGIFAFAIWDRPRRTLHLARDPVGVKPLYYHRRDGTLAFASEIKALVQSGLMEAEVDEESLRKFMFYRYIPDERTMFKDVFKMLPGDIITVADGAVTQRNFRQGPQAVRKMSEEECAAELRKRLKAAVRCQLVSDVPVGTYLSGGIDSSTVTAIAEMNTEIPLDSFSVEFQSNDEAIKSEVEFAQKLSERFNVKNRKVVVKDEEVIRELPLIAWHYDEPMGDAATVPTFFISRRAKERVTVVLSGEGGDEQFGGYAKYQQMLALVADGRRPGADELAAAYMQRISVFTVPEMAQLFHGFDEKGFTVQVVAFLRPQFEGATAETMLNRMLEFDQRTMLCENYLMKADKMTMAHGIEERVPLLDLNMLTFSQAVPPELKIKGENEKYILKQTMRDLLSENITDRKKQGYGTPTAVWFRGELGRLFARRIERSEAFRRHFNLDYIKALLENHQGSKENNNTKLWSLLAFDLWYEVYIRRRDVRPAGDYASYLKLGAV